MHYAFQCELDMRIVGVRSYSYPHPVAVRRHPHLFGSPRNDLRKIPEALADASSASDEFRLNSRNSLHVCEMVPTDRRARLRRSILAARTHTDDGSE